MYVRVYLATFYHDQTHFSIAPYESVIYKQYCFFAVMVFNIIILNEV